MVSLIKEEIGIQIAWTIKTYLSDIKRDMIAYILKQKY